MELLGNFVGSCGYFPSIAGNDEEHVCGIQVS